MGTGKTKSGFKTYIEMSTIEMSTFCQRKHLSKSKRFLLISIRIYFTVNNKTTYLSTRGRTEI